MFNPQPTDQPYLVLIDQLLDCPNGGELGLLNANLALLDDRWEALMLQRAGHFTAAHDEEKAAFLIKIVDLWRGIKRVLPEL